MPSHFRGQLVQNLSRYIKSDQMRHVSKTESLIHVYLVCHVILPPPPLRGVSPTSPYFLELWSAFSHWLMAAIVPLFPGLLSSQPCRHSSFPVLIALMYSCTHSSLWKFRTFRCQQNETTFCRIFWNSIQMKNIFKNRMKLGNGHIKCRFSTLTVSFLSKLAFFIVV